MAFGSIPPPCPLDCPPAGRGVCGARIRRACPRRACARSDAKRLRDLAQLFHLGRVAQNGAKCRIQIIHRLHLLIRVVRFPVRPVWPDGKRLRKIIKKWSVSFAHQAAQKLLDLWILYELLNRRRILHQALDTVALRGRKPAEHAAHISALHLPAQIRRINPHLFAGHG